MTFFELVDLGTVLHGAVITLQGRITRVDRDPGSDTIVSTDCFFLTDGTRTALYSHARPPSIRPSRRLGYYGASNPVY